MRCCELFVYCAGECTCCGYRKASYGSTGTVATLWHGQTYSMEVIQYVQSKRCGQTLNNTTHSAVDYRPQQRQHKQQRYIIVRHFPLESSTVAPVTIACFPQGFDLHGQQSRGTFAHDRSTRPACAVEVDRLHAALAVQGVVTTRRNTHAVPARSCVVLGRFRSAVV